MHGLTSNCNADNNKQKTLKERQFLESSYNNENCT